MLLLPTPLPARFPSIQLSSPNTRLHLSLQTSQCSASAAETSVSLSVDKERGRDMYGDENDDQNDVLSLHRRRYDFTPLLNYLSRSKSASDSDSDSVSPTSLDPIEFQLAESYRAVPAPLWHSLLKSLCDSSSSSSSSSSINLAYAVVSWLQRHNLCFSYELLYSILIHALGRSEKLYEAFLLSQRQTLTPLTYNALINACARNNDLEKALNLMSRMRQNGYQSDFVNYSLIIQSLTRNNKIDSSLLQKLYGEIECDRIEVDGQLLNDIIVGFAKANDPSRALKFLATAQAIGSGLKPRTRAYNALLKGYVKAGSLKDAEWESARIVLKEMQANNVKPNSFVYSRILASYRNKGEWQRSFQVLREMKSNGIQPDRHFYNVMIDTFGKYNCLDHAMATFDRMLSEGIEPDTVTWNTLIDCHCKAGRAGKVGRCEELVGEDAGRRLVANIVTYTTLVDIYGKSGRFSDAIECLEHMKSAGLKPSSTMYNALINAYAQRGLSEQAMNALRVMGADGLKPNLLALNSLINAFVTYTTLMKALIRVDKFHKVPSVFEEMILSGCTPDRKARAMLRSALRYMKQAVKS
ncbi:Pentatricopeptide repeat-containing protein [Hibiscus syriacus]|uniref:Pentatricopeptide repeat-containing protein n=1 Tax=Hibiscus syriacus TaxID=106335 RepID=A0A6A2YM24_HIBSY|nr:Pentatricopeptide repeat-containing protein [Hibiscus syriacus]